MRRDRRRERGRKRGGEGGGEGRREKEILEARRTSSHEWTVGEARWHGHDREVLYNETVRFRFAATVIASCRSIVEVAMASVSYPATAPDSREDSPHLQPDCSRSPGSISRPGCRERPANARAVPLGPAEKNASYPGNPTPEACLVAGAFGSPVAPFLRRPMSGYPWLQTLPVPALVPFPPPHPGDGLAGEVAFPPSSRRATEVQDDAARHGGLL